MCQPLGQSPVARELEYYSFKALVSDQSMADGGRNPLGGANGRDEKGGKSQHLFHPESKGSLQGSLTGRKPVGRELRPSQL